MSCLKRISSSSDAANSARAPGECSKRLRGCRSAQRSRSWRCRAATGAGKIEIGSAKAEPKEEGMPEMPEKREKPESVTAMWAAEKRRSLAAVRCGACHSNVAGGEEELGSLQSTTATSSFFVGLVEKRALLEVPCGNVVWQASSFQWSRGREGMRRRLALARIEFRAGRVLQPVDTAVLFLLVLEKTLALTQEQLQQVTDAGDSWRRWSDRRMRWSLANS